MILVAYTRNLEQVLGPFQKRALVEVHVN
jgi:hypothetical protein